MRAPLFILAALAFALPAVRSAPALAADTAGTAKKDATPEKKPQTLMERVAAKRAEKEKADKEKADKEKADKEKADKEKADKEKANACSPTCTPTCDCEGKPIATAKCSPTCTATCDCDGKPIVKATVDTKKVADDPKAAEDAKKKADEDAKKKADDAKKAAEEQKAAEAKAAGPIDALRKDRPERRKQSTDRLRRRWGVALAQPNAQGELKLHARRVALLQRIRATAVAKKDGKTVEVVDELLTKEDERNSKVMNSLREGALPAVTP